MKKTIRWICMAVAAVFLTLGIVFSVLRPTYVEEALDILFHNELTVEQIAEDNDISEPMQ